METSQSPSMRGRVLAGCRQVMWWSLATGLAVPGCRGGPVEGVPLQTAPAAAGHPIRAPEPLAVADPVAGPPVPATWVSVPVPYPEDAVVVGRVRSPLPVALFPDEEARVRRRVAAQLETLDFDVVPLADLERIEAAAAGGRLLLEDDRHCAVPLTPKEVMERYFAAHRRAYVYATCSPDCTVSVLVNQQDRDAQMLRFVSQPIRAPHDPSEWTGVTLKPDGVSLTWGFGPLSGGSTDAITVIGVDAIGPWRSEPTDAIAESLRDDPTRCANPDVRVHAQWSLVVSVDRTGAIDRCVATSQELGAREGDGECLCEQVQTAKLGRGRGGRRLLIRALDQGLVLGAERLEPLQPGTQAWSRRLLATPGVVECLRMTSGRLDWQGTAVLPLSESGRVGDARLFGEVTTPALMDFAQCLVREMGNASLPCSPPGIEELHLGVVLESL